MPADAATPDSGIVCPFCSSQTVSHLDRAAHGKVWRLRRCVGCGHGFVANRPTIKELSVFYAAEGGGHGLGSSRITEADMAGATDAAELADLTSRATTLRGRTLDVGSGNGSFTYHLHKAGFSPNLLIDFDTRSGEATRFIPGASFQLKSFEDVTDDEGPFAAILMSQVLEHALDPASWVRRCRELLLPGGVLIIAVPNFGGPYRLMGDRDPFINPPEHLNHFTPASMRRLIESHGLVVKFLRSASRMALHGAHDRPLSTPSRLARVGWNLATLPLALTPRGIILRCVCVKPAGSASDQRRQG